MTLTTRLALAMILLVTIVVSAVGWLNYRSLEQALLPRVLERIEAHSRLVAADVESYVSGVRGDIASFRSAAGLNGFMRARLAGGVDTVNSVPEAIWLEQLTNGFSGALGAKPVYAALCLIGVENGARQIIRVDRSGPNGEIRKVSEAELESKSEQAYFKETLKLPPGEIYVSPLDLDRDSRATETPYWPTLRMATAIFAPDGKAFGIFVVTVDMRPVLDRVRSSAQEGGQIYVVNDRGDYLVHPNPAREFGTELGTLTDWRADFPLLARALEAPQGVVSAVADQAGQRGAAALAPAMLAGTEWLGIIETVPNAILNAPAAAIRNTSLLVGSVAVLFAAALALFVARSLTWPINQLTAAVEGIGQDNPIRIPVDATGETGVLARAFARVMGEANAKTTALQREVAEHRRTEAARDHYEARERLYSAAVESSSDAIITQSLDGTITGWNPAAERLFGYTAEEAVGRNIDLIMPPGRMAEAARDVLRRIGSGQTIEHYESECVRKGGRPVEVMLGISSIKTPSGEIIGASKTARDITESKRTERALRQQLEERRRIFETSQDLIMVTDSRGVLVQISPSCETILGYQPKEMIGHSTDEFVHAGDLDSARDEIRSARRGRHSRNFDTRFVHKNGRIVALSWAGTWAGPVGRFFFVGRDMTESRLAQETLRESEQLARGIIDSALDAFIQMDEHGFISDWNSQAEKMFGWSRTEALGKQLAELIIPEAHRAAHREGVAHFLLTGEGPVLGRRFEIEARRRDGTEIKVELSITALRRRDGIVFNGFIRDLTDKIAAEDRIRQAEKMEAVGQLTGGIAHDFNNILTVITGTIEILSGAVATEPQLAAITKMIDEAAARGADLTRHLLAFARKQPLQPRETDVNTLIIDTARLLRPALGAHIEIESVFADEACMATVDPNQLTTAILNLALNARDAMPEGGKLILETGSAYLDENCASIHGDVRPGRYVLIAVSDTGTGIPAGIRDKVFNPFFTSKGPGKGTGLGLSMVYGFVKQSAGHIDLYSEVGHGTTVKMYLPPAMGARLASEIASAPAIRGGRETILVVEDDRLVRDYVLTQLHSLGYVTLDAANGADALAIIEAGNEFDLLFTDVMMQGGMNGRQLANALQKRKPGLRVLFTSGYTENAIIHHGRLDAGVLLLAKPYRKSEMAAMIRKALDGQRASDLAG